MKKLIENTSKKINDFISAFIKSNFGRLLIRFYNFISKLTSFIIIFISATILLAIVIKRKDSIHKQIFDTKKYEISISGFFTTTQKKELKIDGTTDLDRIPKEGNLDSIKVSKENSNPNPNINLEDISPHPVHSFEDINPNADTIPGD